jgi:hypothetical protein
MAMAPKKMRGGGMVKKMRGGGMVKKMKIGGAVGATVAGAGAGAGTLLKGAAGAAAGAGKELAAAAGKRAPSQPKDAKGVRTFEQSLSDFRKQATARGYNLVPNKKNN